MDPAEFEVWEVPGKGNLIRNHQAAKGRTQNHFRDKMNDRWPKNDFADMQSNFGKPIERKQNPDGRQARLSKVEGVNLNGGFEQRRSGWGQSGNKTACFER